MQTKIILLLILWSCCTYLSGQQSEKKKRIYSNTGTVFIPNGNIGKNVKKIIVCPPESDTLITYKIGNTEVHYQVIQDVKNVIMKFWYTVNESGPGSEIYDFPEAKYNVQDSKAMLNMMECIKDSIILKYDSCLKARNQKILSVKITGGADATPIVGNILYNGEFGPKLKELCNLNGTPKIMEVNTGQKIIENPYLAFLRAVAGRYYFINDIFNRKDMQPVYILESQVSALRGGQFRRIAVEMVLTKP
jgi:hypothetical protein